MLVVLFAALNKLFALVIVLFASFSLGVLVNPSIASPCKLDSFTRTGAAGFAFAFVIGDAASFAFAINAFVAPAALSDDVMSLVGDAPLPSLLAAAL